MSNLTSKPKFLTLEPKISFMDGGAALMLILQLAMRLVALVEGLLEARAKRTEQAEQLLKARVRQMEEARAAERRKAFWCVVIVAFVCVAAVLACRELSRSSQKAF